MEFQVCLLQDALKYLRHWIGIPFVFRFSSRVAVSKGKMNTILISRAI
jgi:hypothetical protein